MKKKFLSIVLIGISLSIAGCGKKEEVKISPERSEVQTEETEHVTEDPHEKEALAGVYMEGENIVRIPMGTYYGGEQTDLVSVQIPDNYLMGAIYYLGDDKDGLFEMADGDDIVKDALDNGLLEQENKLQDVFIACAGGETIDFCVTTSDDMSFNEFKEKAGQYNTLASGAYETIYYVDPNEYITADLSMCYAINADVTLYITYEGPLADEIGLDQLARNLYELVEVIE